jgi:DNA polymerase I-like protein with 3'-5' exonuclease and polymerase domains
VDGHVTFLGKTYIYRNWHRRDTLPLQDLKVVSLDTETHMVVEGSPIVPVIMQVCIPKHSIVHIVNWQDMNEYLDVLLSENPDLKIAMHTAGFDLWSCNHPLLWKFADDNKVIDVCIRWLHKKLSEGQNPPEMFNLSAISKDMLGVDLDKNEEVRLKFDRNVPITEKQYEYAALDAIATLRILDTMPIEYPGEAYQTKGYIALKTIGDTGMLVDKEYRPNMLTRYQKLLDSAKEVVNLYGVYPGDKLDKGQKVRIREILQSYERRYKIEFPRTEKTGALSLTQDTESLFEDAGIEVPVFIKNFLNLSHYQKFIETYLTDKHVHTDGRVHPMWMPVLKTGRASARKPNTTNLPRDENIRAIYTAPKGHVLVALDYSQMELCMLAESCYQFYGKSVMRDIINSGVDLHTWFGNKIKEKSQSLGTVDFRQLAKCASFGFPGGLGIARFILYAKNDWGVELSEQMAKELYELWKETFPEMEYHLQPAPDEEVLRKTLYIASKQLFPNDPPVTNVYDLKKKLQDNGKDKEFVDEVLKPMRRFVAKTITGRVRPNCAFCEACNYCFQSAGADATKYSAYNVVRAGYRVVNYIHDELLVELPFDDKLHAQVKDISSIMVAGMKEICPNTRIVVEYAAMKSWYKKAKEVYTSNGQLTVWTPDIRKATEIEEGLTKEEHRQLSNNMDPLSKPLYKADGKLYGFQPVKSLLSI